LLLEAKDHDRALLNKISGGDVEGFWAEVQRRNNSYNVCGFSAIALLLELLAGRKGHLLGYDFWQEESTQSAVSFAALAFPFE
jgi:AmmeMemoRadiSam system protein B